jgi:hypothetical protein
MIDTCWVFHPESTMTAKKNKTKIIGTSTAIYQSSRRHQSAFNSQSSFRS